MPTYISELGLEVRIFRPVFRVFQEASLEHELQFRTFCTGFVVHLAVHPTVVLCFCFWGCLASLHSL